MSNNYERDQKFLDIDNWSDIKRGWLFEAVIPYTGERPLDFFIPDEDCPYRGTVVGRNGEFTPSTVQHAILGLKQRKVVVISHDDMCADKSVFDITVAPIYTIYDEDRNLSWYADALQNKHLFYSYLPSTVTGRECVVDLSNIITIGKNMLLSEKKDISEFMPDINAKMEFCLQLGIYKKREEVSREDAG